MALKPYATLSIIVTAHNCEPYLGKTLSSIESACGDTFYLQEVIIVNDSSTDRTGEIVAAFSSLRANVKTYDVNFKNIGKVRNFALSKCSGQYITMIDGDDEVLAGSLKDIASYLGACQPDIHLSPLNELYDDQDKKFIWQGVKACKLTQDNVIKKFLTHKNLQAHFIGQFFSRKFLEKISFPEFICYEDAWTFPLLLNLSTVISYSASSHYLYHKRKGSLSEQVTPEKISLLIAATEQMVVNFGKRYIPLISCHWINILHKYEKEIEATEDINKVKNSIRQVSLLHFLFHPLVRLSFKKKLIRLKLAGKV